MGRGLCCESGQPGKRLMTQSEAGGRGNSVGVGSFVVSVGGFVSPLRFSTRLKEGPASTPFSS